MVKVSWREVGGRGGAGRSVRWFVFERIVEFPMRVKILGELHGGLPANSVGFRPHAHGKVETSFWEAGVKERRARCCGTSRTITE